MDCIITDPPYGVDYVSLANSYISHNNTRKDVHQKKRWHANIKNDNLKGDALKDFCKKFISATKPHWKENAVLYICFAAKNLHHLLQALDEEKISYPVPLIWHKNHFVISWQRYHPDYEIIMYCGPGSAPTGKKSRWYGPKNETTTWQISKDAAKEYEHPTQKPVVIYTRAITNSTAKGQLILDPFSGSGTAIIAAEQTGRQCLAMDLSPEYCEVAIRRWEKLTGKKAVKAS